jgi:ribosomal protein L11 methyltransferase
MQKEWIQVSYEVPDAMVDAVAEFLIELSSNGVGIDNRTLDTFSLDSLEETPSKTVTAYFQSCESLDERIREIKAFLVGVGPNFPGFIYQDPIISKITDEDWSTSWKEHFKPLRVGKHLRNRHSPNHHALPFRSREITSRPPWQGKIINGA